jgi:ABC-type antimicrobial peptide transport system permease subunit
MRSWIERQKKVIDFTLSSLLRRKGKNGALLSVYILIVFILASVMFLTYALKREASLILKDAPEMIVQRMVAGRTDPIPIRYMDKVKDIRGVSAVRGRLWGYYYDPVIGANYTLIVPEDSGLERGSIRVGRGISRMRILDEEDEMEFKAYDGTIFNLKINGIVSPESELISSDLVFISEKDFRRLFGLSKDYVTDLTLRIKNSNEWVVVAEKIAGLLPDTRVILREEILRTYDMVFSWRGGLMLAILSAGLLAFVIFSWDKASGLSAEEKKEIGILKAIGWETSDVIQMKFWEGVAISLTSFFVGTLLAYLHVFFSSSVLFEPVLKGWAILYPKFKLTPFVNPFQIAVLFFLTVVPYTVTTIVPSWRAATVDPDTVMRG